MNGASDPGLDTPPAGTVITGANASFTAVEIGQRRRLYFQTAILANLISSLTSLAALSDGQLNAMSALRWILTASLLVLGAWLAGNNALRAAIDRSTSAPSTGNAA
jgi:hypothetical protein